MRVQKPKERNELPKNDASNKAWVTYVAISSEQFWDIHTTSLNKNTGKHSRFLSPQEWKTQPQLCFYWNRWSLRFRYMWFRVQIQQIGCMNQPFDECDHGCPGVFVTRVHGSCSCRFWILISLAVLLLNLTPRDVHADCEQSLIFLCKATPRVNHARERRFPWVVVCNRAGWGKNWTDFKRKGRLQQCTTDVTNIWHWSLGPGGGTWVFFGWVCAARDSKLAPRSRKNFP